MTPAITTADRLSSAELLDIWNRGFAGYFVDNTMDEARLAKHIRWSGVDLARSAVLLVDDKPAAFSLAAIDDHAGGPAAWIAGFGVAPEHRRQGLAGALMRGHCEILDEAGVQEALLEVIDENPARRVYAAAGFRETRTLHSFQGVPQVPAAATPCQRLDVSSLDALHATLHAGFTPVWRRRLAGLHRILEDAPSAELLAVPAHTGHSAFALAIPGPERLTLLDAAAIDPDAAAQLVSGLAAAHPGRPLRIIDEPTDGPLAQAFVAAGLPPFLTQLEMVRQP